MLKYFALGLLALTTPVAATDSLEILQEVQDEVNFNIEFRLELNGMDKWRIPTSYGDCEDFALLKRETLIKQGWNPNDLVLIMVYSRTNSKTTFEGHIALFSKSKGLVLDSTQINGPKKVKIVDINYYLKDNNYKLFCHIKNIDTSKKFKYVSDRCKN